MTVNTAGGTRFYIGTTAPATSLAEFQSDTYIEVGEVEDLGEYGDAAEEIRFAALRDGRVRKFKGPRDAGTMNVICGKDDSDEGQDAMIAAEGTKFDYNFKVVHNDAETLSGTGSEDYFKGKVMSKRKNVGNVSNVVRNNFNVGVNSEIFTQAAT